MVESIDLACRVLLISVYTFSGISKLKDIGGTKQAMRDFGVPYEKLISLGAALPIMELTIALLLLSRYTAVWGGIMSFIILVAFIGLILNLILHNKSIHCHCFGQGEAAPTGWHTILRNVSLLLLSLIVVLYGKEASSFVSMLYWDKTQWIIFLFLLLFLFQTGILFWAIARSQMFKSRIESLENALFQGLPIGTKAPAFTLNDFRGNAVALADLLIHKKPLLLLFFDPDCAPCQTLLPKAIEWHKQYASVFKIVFIARAGEKNKMIEEVGNIILLNPTDMNLARNIYKTRGFPSAITISAKGIIDNPSGYGELGITQLMSKLL